MIELRTGNILQADVEALVNTVNCVGVMGRGIALQFRKAFPDNYKVYRATCDRKQLRPGMMLVFDRSCLLNPRYIINFPTKRHWRGKSRIEDIRDGLDALVAEVRNRNISSIAIPPLGSGLGGLDWCEVRPLIEGAFRDLTAVEVQVYEPHGPPAPRVIASELTKPRMTIGRAALLGLMRRYLSAVMDPQVSLLEIHKLMYFMQEAGEALRLRYTKAPYGPYAENLRHVLNRIEGHFIIGFGDGQDRPDRQIDLCPGGVAQAEAFLVQHPASKARFDKVVNLISGFETPFGMELLATVHWVESREGAASLDEAIEKTYAWNSRKSMFEPGHIGPAWEALSQQGWLNAAG